MSRLRDHPAVVGLVCFLPVVAMASVLGYALFAPPEIPVSPADATADSARAFALTDQRVRLERAFYRRADEVESVDYGCCGGPRATVVSLPGGYLVDVVYPIRVHHWNGDPQVSRVRTVYFVRDGRFARLHYFGEAGHGRGYGDLRGADPLASPTLAVVNLDGTSLAGRLRVVHRGRNETALAAPLATSGYFVTRRHRVTVVPGRYRVRVRTDDHGSAAGGFTLSPSTAGGTVYVVAVDGAVYVRSAS